MSGNNMQSRPIVSCVEEAVCPRDGHSFAAASIIRCYLYPVVVPTLSTAFGGNRLLAAQAMRLLLRLDAYLREVRADWNRDRFRRLMRLRPKAVKRLRRRWAILNPLPQLPLGSLSRRYHANLACYLYEFKR